MIHRRYLASKNGKESDLGVLGERHSLTAVEVDFAEKVIQRYKAFAKETGFGKLSREILVPGLLVCTPIRTIDDLARGRYGYKSTPQIAEILRREIVELEDDVGLVRGVLTSLLLMTSPITTPMALLRDAVNGELRGDPYAPGRIDERFLSPDYNPYQSFPGKIRGFVLNSENRELKMAKRAYELVQQGRTSLLLSVGRSHMNGLTRNLANMFDRFELIEQKTPDYR